MDVSDRHCDVFDLSSDSVGFTCIYAWLVVNEQGRSWSDFVDWNSKECEDVLRVDSLLCCCCSRRAHHPMMDAVVDVTKGWELCSSDAWTTWLRIY